MHKLPFWRKVVLASTFFAALCTYSSTLAQTTSGDLVGSVKDATGAVVANATIVITSESTGVVSSVQGSATGEFRASNLLPAKYDLVFSAAGFQRLDLKGVLVELNKTSTANVTLSVGASQSVEVTAESGAILDTTSTNLSQTFSTQALATLPTASVGFGVLNASLLSPGVASSGGIGIGIGPSVGGQRPRNNNFTIEGIDNNNKSVTGPLVYIPNDAVGSFTLITNQFAPEFGHSSGGQFSTNVLSGTNHFHGKLYEYFDNRNLNAASGTAGGKSPNPRYDFNRYGAELGGFILPSKLFFFGGFERQTTGQSLNYFLCTPTAAGLSTLGSLNYGFNSTNLAQYAKYMPAANYYGGAQVTDANDLACGNQPSGPQYLTVGSGTTFDAGSGLYLSGSTTNIPLGNYHVSAPTFSNFDALTTSMDYTISSKDSLRGRYLYNTEGAQDTTAYLPAFFTTQPYRYHLVSLSEFHSFTPNLTNEFRLGFNRYVNNTPAGNFSFPGLDSFPNLTFYDQNGLNLGPDSNAPQSTIQNLYQAVNNVSYVKGNHTLKIGFDGRKYISPQTFTQRVRGDYQWNILSEYLHDLAPTAFGERSTGNIIYYGDQTALYGYVNDTWRARPTITLNAGLRYEFTSVPVGERAQSLNAAASFPGLINFHAPQPAYKNFAPRVGINWAPDTKTSIRAGFGVAYDVLFDNLGLLSFPPQYSSTNDVGSGTNKNPGDPNFLASGGLPAGTGGIATFPSTTAGLAAQRAATSAFVPDQVTPYAETYTLTIQRTIGSSYTAELGYIGTRGIHLPTQDQLNVQPRVTAANQLTTSLTGASTIATSASANTLAQIQKLSNIVPGFLAAGFTSKITSYQPYSSSNYNSLVANLQRQFQNGLQMNLSYTWSKDMDDATAEVFATVLTPRRPQNSQNVGADYSRSALDRTHRLTLEAVYDLPYFRHSNFLLKNVVGNWTFSPIYTYESPEYATALSGVNSNLNGDSGTYIDRPIINPNGVKGTASGVTAQYSSTLASLCGAGVTRCSANLVGYVANDPNAYYIQAGIGTLPTAGRNTLAIRPIDNVDFAAYKRITFFEHYNVEFGAQAFNLLNHAQYTAGTVDNINQTAFTSSLAFQTVTSAFFNHPEKIFTNNARSMQLSGKISF
ncbi:MAG TPA: carboxypeptidase regulatory-like domain-containing protein [Granulicella sp.]|jgi:hypothetical protein|nr:carboxypeptidase regulatory-like domain-containing protein [Granulicella sp.]